MIENLKEIGYRGYGYDVAYWAGFLSTWFERLGTFSYGFTHILFWPYSLPA